MGHWHNKHWKLGLATSASSTIKQILDQVAVDIKFLALTDIVDASVLVKKLPLEHVFTAKTSTVDLPGVLITPARDQIPPNAGDNLQDDYIYQVVVTFVDADNQEETIALNLDKYMLWRQRVTKAFNRKRLSGIATVFTATVEPAEAVIPAAWSSNLYASALLLKFFSRETR